MIDHRRPIAKQVKAIVPEGVNYMLALTRTEDHSDEIVEAPVPQGALAFIENSARPVRHRQVKAKEHLASLGL